LTFAASAGGFGYALCLAAEVILGVGLKQVRKSF
jgi:hypothetical protein